MRVLEVDVNLHIFSVLAHFQVQLALARLLGNRCKLLAGDLVYTGVGAELLGFHTCFDFVQDLLAVSSL